ncbi:MAG: ribonuclease III [Clostridiales bacterium]|nr:ribonuclease III [Clostridiales bacterium]
MRLLTDDCDVKNLSPLTLAFVGDGVYELMVRERLVCEANRPVNDLHRLSVAQVKAAAQKRAADALLPVLTGEELAVYKRGRNAKTGHTPKHASEADYHAATGLEALFGYLYLSGGEQRLRELFGLIQGLE